MSGIDAKFLYSDTATTHMHTIKVAVSDVSGVPGGFSYESFVEVLRQQLCHLPPFRRRVVTVPLSLGHPWWIEDPGFDLRNHVSRRQAPAPGTLHQLAAVVAEFAGTPLRRDRPLWEVIVVEGLEAWRMAAVAKVHHAVADGTATVALLQNVVHAVGEATTEPPEDRWQPEPIPSRRELLRLAAHQHADRLRGLPELVSRSVHGARASQARRKTLSVKPPLPLQTPRTSFNVSLTRDRTFAMTTLPLDDLKAIKSAQGITLNDVYLAVCAGAVRRYLKDNGELPGRSLMASVPVSIDPNAARMSGNRVDNLYVTLGTDIDDPLRRLRHCSEVARSSKEVRSMLGNDLMEQRAEILPPQLYSAVVRLWSRSGLASRVRPPINLVVSNVAGPREHIRLGPIELEALYSAGPILEGIGLNLTAWSYVDALHVSALGCSASLPDPWRVIDALHGSLAELLAAAGTQAPAEAPTA